MKIFHKNSLLLVAGLLCFFAIGWFAAEQTVCSLRFHQRAKVRQGMTRIQVDNILRAPVISESVRSDGETTVNYSIEYHGVMLEQGASYAVQFDSDGKVSRSPSNQLP